ncbi:MAG: mechanosensitive ion channel family protein [Verrucomicrobiia bacterium]
MTHFRQMADYFLEVEIVFWAVYTTGREYWNMMTPIHLAIKEKFDEAGIEFAFPTQTLHIEGLKK